MPLRSLHSRRIIRLRLSPSLWRTASMPRRVISRSFADASMASISCGSEKMRWYVASELRDRIRHSGVEIKVIDRIARAEYTVEPRQFEGRLLHDICKLVPEEGQLYLELYLAGQDASNNVGLYRSGTRVL